MWERRGRSKRRGSDFSDLMTSRYSCLAVCSTAVLTQQVWAEEALHFSPPPLLLLTGELGRAHHLLHLLVPILHVLLNVFDHLDLAFLLPCPLVYLLPQSPGWSPTESPTNISWSPNWPPSPPKVYSVDTLVYMKLGDPGIRQGHSLNTQLALHSQVYNHSRSLCRPAPRCSMRCGCRNIPGVKKTQV